MSGVARRLVEMQLNSSVDPLAIFSAAKFATKVANVSAACPVDRSRHWADSGSMSSV